MPRKTKPKRTSAKLPWRLALRLESERNLRLDIERLLRKPMSRRTHFLRVRVGPWGGSAV